MKARAIAFYLPQYHPIEENDAFWGKGFTEWTNVTKARPLFKGHDQPFLPSDLGFYDLRVPETREQQAEFARQAGIEGFCYWHYWFGNGARALERIFDEVVTSKKPDFPFCLGWANESWTGKWHGLDDKTLFAQLYPGESDYVAHFYSILPALLDKRYICVDGKPLFLIYTPENLPSFPVFKNLWERLAIDNGLPGIHWVSNGSRMGELYTSMGFNAFAVNRLSMIIESNKSAKEKLKSLLAKRMHKSLPHCLDYQTYCAVEKSRSLSTNEYPVLYPNWDSTPRLGGRGHVLKDPDPACFGTLLRDVVSKIASRPESHRILFIKSWNEWAEGNTLEPSRRFSNQILLECAKVLHG